MNKNEKDINEEILENVSGGKFVSSLRGRESSPLSNDKPEFKPDWHGPASTQPGGVDWNGWHGPADAQSNND